MLNLLVNLPLELVGTHLLAYLSLNDIVLLERACCSKKSQNLFLCVIPYCPPVIIPLSRHTTALAWCMERRCKISSLNVFLPWIHPGLHLEDLRVDSIHLEIKSGATVECLRHWVNCSVRCKVRSVCCFVNQNREVMEQLSACTGNVEQLNIRYSNNCMDWITVDILSRWKLKEVEFYSSPVSTSLVLLIVQTCTELTSIKMYTSSVDNAAVIAIAQHCHKLETLQLATSNITWTSLLALSEHGLSLEELSFSAIPNIPTTPDIARRCSHALSRIRHLDTRSLYRICQIADMILPLLTCLTSLYLNCRNYHCLPRLAQHCHTLTMVTVNCNGCCAKDILSLCRANPLLQELYCNYIVGITDTALIELIHACPHLHTLRLTKATNITDLGILSLSEHCTELQMLDINKCHKVTEAAVLQLLQRCHKLTRLEVSSSSLLEETWTQLDNNTQKRVVLC